MENRIKELEAQVAALQMVAIALIDAFPGGTRRQAGDEFREHTNRTILELRKKGLIDAADRFGDAAAHINARSPVHPDL